MFNRILQNLSLAITLVAVGGLILTACDGDDSATNTTSGSGTGSGTMENLGERADEIAQQAQAAWRQFVDELNSRLARYQPEIDQIKASAQDKADAQLDQLVAELDEKTAAARTKLEELRADLANATDDERAVLNQLMEEVADALLRAKARLTELGGGVQPPSLSGGGGAPIDD
jgi:hypothetical protein